MRENFYHQFNNYLRGVYLEMESVNNNHKENTS